MTWTCIHRILCTGRVYQDALVVGGRIDPFVQCEIAEPQGRILKGAGLLLGRDSVGFVGTVRVSVEIKSETAITQTSR